MNQENPREKFLLTNPKEAEYQAEKLALIGVDVSAFKREVEDFGCKSVKLIGDAVRIGQNIIDLCQRLPGKEMTVDFWQQMGKLLKDANGHEITFRQLRFFVRIAKNAADVVKPQEALAWRNELFEAGGMSVEGGTVGLVAHHTNYYNKLLSNLDPRKLEKPLAELMNDDAFGPLLDWTDERKERVRLQIEPFKKKLDELYEQLEVK